MHHRTWAAATLLLATAGTLACPSTQTKTAPPAERRVEAPTLPPAPARNRVSPFDAGTPLPDSIMVLAGLPSLQSVGELVSAMSAAAGLGNRDDVLEVEAVLLDGLATGFGWSDSSWVDLKAPLYAVMAEQKRFPDALALLVPVNNFAAALDSLPKTPGSDVGQHLRAYRHEGKAVYVDVVGHHLVLTSHPQLFDAIKGTLAKTVAWAPQGIGTVYLLASTIRQAFAKEIQSMMAALPALLDLAGGNPLVDMESMIALPMGVFAQSDLYRLTAKRTSLRGAAHIGLEMAILPVRGSGLAQLMQHLSKAKLPYPTMMPSTAWLGGLSDMDLRDVAMYQRFVKAQTRVIASKLRELTGDKAADRLIVLGDDLAKATTGKTMFALHADGGFPLGISALASFDGELKAMQAMYNEYAGLYLPVLWGQLVDGLQEFGAAVPKLKRVTSKALLKLANKLLKKAALRLKTVHKGKGPVLSNALVLAATKRSKKQHADTDLSALHRALASVGGTLEAALAFGPQGMSMSFGPNGLANAEALAGGTGMGGSSHTRAVGADAAMVMAFNVGELVSALKAAPVIGQFFSMDAVPSTDAAVISFNSDGREGVLSLSMPESYIELIGKLMMF